MPPPSPPRVVALFGPTGVGKTAIAIALADALRAEGEDPVAVSADALQLYRGLELLTGVPDLISGQPSVVAADPGEADLPVSTAAGAA